MKKFLLIILLIISSIFIYSDKSFSYVYAEDTNNNTLSIHTIYPNNILEYQELSNIQHVTTNDNYIAYSTHPTTISILDKNSREHFSSTNFSNITKIKYVSNNQLLVVDYDKSLKLGNISLITINNKNLETEILDSINLTGLHLIDIYDLGDKVYIGIIKLSNSSNYYFELYSLKNNNYISTIEIIDTDSQNSSFYEDSNNLVINDSTLFISTTNTLKYRNFGDNNNSTTNISIDIQNLDYYEDEVKKFLIASTAENLHLLSINHNTLGNSLCYLTPIKASSIDIHNSKIYISDNTNKTIKTYSITNTNDEYSILEAETLIASSNDSLGRFNNVSDIYLQGDTIYVSDKNNDRIQIINEDFTCVEISDFPHNTKPQSIILDSHQNLYFVKTISESLKTSSVVKYTKNLVGYEEVKSWQTNLGLVSDTAISNNDDIYIIDYTNNSLVKLNNNTGLQTKLIFDFTTSQNTKIEYIKKLDLFAILESDKIYLLDAKKLDTNENSIVNTITCNNAKDITCSMNSIFVLNNNKISLITISDNTMQLSEKHLENDILSRFTCITYNIQNNQIFAFDSLRHCIVYFDSNLTSQYFNISKINEPTLSEKSNAPTAINIINNGVIYDLPYSTGKEYTNITNCISIGSIDNYHKVIFEYDKQIRVGFLDFRYANTISHQTTKKLRVLTTNQKVPVYKYPTLLKYEGKSIISSYIPINTFINISYHEFPTSIDTKIFYSYEIDGKVGYIFNADIVLDDSKNIVPLNTNNASINSLGKTEQVYIYNEDKSTVVATLYHDDKIYVESYDKNSEYTLVIYKTEDLSTITGYVKTEYIEMDELDNSKIVLICIIIISVIMLITIFISYFVIKKKKNI